jgi:hypothetical protein
MPIVKILGPDTQGIPSFVRIHIIDHELRKSSGLTEHSVICGEIGLALPSPPQAVNSVFGVMKIKLNLVFMCTRPSLETVREESLLFMLRPSI